MAQHLFEIVKKYNQITERIIENGGELPDDLERELSEVNTNLVEKVDSYNYILERLKTEADYWKEKAQALKRVSDSCSSLRERIKHSIKEAISALGDDEVRGNDVRFKLSKNAGRLIIDETKLPASYLIEVVTHVPDKERIKTDLASGKTIPGAFIEPGFTLRSYPNKKGK